MDMENTVETFCATEACAKCKGSCCKRMGCHYSPRDFSDLSFEGLKAKIEKGNISIDWWEGYYDNEYYLRARHIGAPVVDPSWGGVCVNLTDKGCALSWDERPLGGKALKPQADGRCSYTSYSKKDCKNEWLQYAEVLERLVNYFDR